MCLTIVIRVKSRLIKNAKSCQNRKSKSKISEKSGVKTKKKTENQC